MALDIEEQYEKIYRYCFCRLHSREQAEDVTQETFLRWFASDTYRDRAGQAGCGGSGIGVAAVCERGAGQGAVWAV